MSVRSLQHKLRIKWNRVPLLTLLEHLPFLFALLGIGFVLYDIGFNQSAEFQSFIRLVISGLMGMELLFQGVRYLAKSSIIPFKVWIFDLLMMLCLVCTMLVWNGIIDTVWFHSDFWMTFLFVWVLIREFSSERIELKRKGLNPAQLFITSFLLIILAGAFALTFPNATTHGIGFIDALFTSTSAVCVTGLSTVDTGTSFTLLGYVILMVLIQLGGLGIMTFTSYFSYFFTGISSYENQFLIQEMTNSNKVAEVFSTLKRVLLLTFAIEGLGVLSIYESLDVRLMPELGDRLFFSLFHAVSAFCNAGFSTLSDNLYDIHYRFNYPLHMSVAFLIILGGLGFPILFNFIQYLKHLVKNRFSKYNHRHQPWIINLNTRIVLVTTLLLLVSGAALFYWIEYDNTLAEHGPFGKLVTAFFLSVTPRTAGFNTVNNAAMHTSTVLWMFFLMWVGASPASTGGGIKTSTFAITVLNAIGLARGKDKIELYGRQLSESSIRRAYAQVFMSLLAIFVGVLLVMTFDPKLSLLSVGFECISAFGTVGLSLGITPDLTDASKLVLSALMFVGRVSLLSVFAAILKQVRFQKYAYPSEDITIN